MNVVGPINISELKRDDEFFFEKDFAMNHFDGVKHRYRFYGELRKNEWCFSLVDQTGHLRNPPTQQVGVRILVRKIVD